MNTSVGKRRGRKPRNTVVYYKCSVCEYISERYYNVTRHEFRIHTTSAKKRQCCDTSFATKGDYYLHCEERHPLSRAATIVSRSKYKILSGITIVKNRGTSLSSSDQSSSKVEFVAPPYQLRNKTRGNNAGPKKRFGNFDDSEFTSDFDSSSDEESNDESRSDVLSRDSSGYDETKNLSLDINQNEIEAKNAIKVENLDRCADQVSDRANHGTETDSSDFDLRPGETSISSNNGGRDETLESLTSGYAESMKPFVLPIKKRILRDITNRRNASHVESSTSSYLDRLGRRTTCEPRGKSRNFGKKVNNSRITANNDENVPPLSSISDRQKCENGEKVQVQVDPRISWHDFTQLHREYFDSLLRNRSFLDRFRCCE